MNKNDVRVHLFKVDGAKIEDGDVFRKKFFLAVPLFRRMLRCEIGIGDRDDVGVAVFLISDGRLPDTFQAVPHGRLKG